MTDNVLVAVKVCDNVFLKENVPFLGGNRGFFFKIIAMVEWDPVEISLKQ